MKEIWKKMPRYEEYSVVYHLVGGEVLPIFISALQFPKETKHVLLVTGSADADVPSNLKLTLEKRGIKTEVWSLGAPQIGWDYKRLLNEITHRLQEDISRYSKGRRCMDITGGTKPMALSSLFAAQRENIPVMYMDTSDRKSLWLGKEIEEEPLINKMMLKEYFLLQGVEPHIKQDHVLPSAEFLNFIYSKRDILYGHLKKYEEMGIKTLKKDLFEEFLQGLNQDTAWASKAWEENKQGPFWTSLKWKDQRGFLQGMWFEYYVYATLEKCEIITEIAHGLSVFDGKKKLQEFDVIYTDGFSMRIVECKAGELEQNYFHKLANQCKKYSGALEVAAMATALPLSKALEAEALKERVKKEKEVGVFCGDEGVNCLKQSLFSFRGKCFYPEIEGE